MTIAEPDKTGQNKSQNQTKPVGTGGVIVETGPNRFQIMQQPQKLLTYYATRNITVMLTFSQQ